MKLKKHNVLIESVAKMYAQSAFTLKFMNVLRKGVIVGLRETIHDYDDVVGNYVSIVVSDRQFRWERGVMFCKNASSFKWDEQPLIEPFNFLLDILNEGGVEQAYVVENNKETIIWTETDGWMSAKKMRMLFIPKGVLTKPTLCYNQANSLKCLCAQIAFNAQGPIKMLEFKHYMDFEVQTLVFKPCVWWVSL